MLATILKSSVATKVSIAIMDAFVEMRKYIANNNYDKRLSNVETQLIEHNNKINDYDNKSEINITIIDNYIDKSFHK